MSGGCPSSGLLQRVVCFPGRDQIPSYEEQWIGIYVSKEFSEEKVSQVERGLATAPSNSAAPMAVKTPYPRVVGMPRATLIAMANEARSAALAHATMRG